MNVFLVKCNVTETDKAVTSLVRAEMVKWPINTCNNEIGLVILIFTLKEIQLFRHAFHCILFYKQRLDRTCYTAKQNCTE